MSQILVLMMQHNYCGEWSGNQNVQNAFCKGLEEAGLKKAGVQYDPHSGGPRTYQAQLKCLGLIFEKDGRMLATKAGDDLANGFPPLPIMQSMLLRHQYPSTYGSLPNVHINPRIRVKPFLFVLKLLNHPKIVALTNEELAIPVVFGHMSDCIEICVKKILELRDGAKLADMFDDRQNDLYLPRSAGAGKTIPNILDIANTCKNYLQACCLISVERIDGVERILFSEEMRALYEDALKLEEQFIPLGPEEAFQRAYGAWDRIKDTRQIIEPAKRIVSAEEGVILSQFYRLCGEQIVSEVPEAFVEEMRRSFGFDKSKVLDAILPHIANSLDFFEATFLELSKGGAAKAIAFEKAVCSLFNDRLHFKAKHTGQLRRLHGIGGYSDVFAISADDQTCGIVDAKASPTYNLASSDYLAMTGNYIPNYRELAEGNPLSLEFCMYVAGGFSGDIDYKLRSMKAESGVGSSAIKAIHLLYLAKEDVTIAQQQALVEVFKSGHVLNSIRI